MSNLTIGYIAVWTSVSVAVCVGLVVTGNPICLLGFLIAFIGTIVIM